MSKTDNILNLILLIVAYFCIASFSIPIIIDNVIDNDWNITSNQFNQNELILLFHYIFFASICMIYYPLHRMLNCNENISGIILILLILITSVFGNLYVFLY